MNFMANVLHIQPKPDRGRLSLKGKRDGDKSAKRPLRSQMTQNLPTQYAPRVRTSMLEAEGEISVGQQTPKRRVCHGRP
jgi:hypothetical protein